MGELWYVLMKNVTFRVLFTEGGTLWKRVPKRIKKSCPVSWFLGRLFDVVLLQKSNFRAFVWHLFFSIFFAWLLGGPRQQFASISKSF